jgi:peroxiredoxin/outer membrane lipoprotein-sorting protein
MLKPIAAILLAFAVLSAPARAEQAPDARALLQKVGQAYRDLTSYRFEGVMTVKMSGGINQSLEVPLELAADRAGRARVVIQNPQMGMTSVSDGKQTVTYLPSLGQYRRKPAEAAVDSGGMPLPPQGSPLTRYFNLLQNLSSAQVLGAQAVDVGGTAHDCWVVHCEMVRPEALSADSSAHAAATFWIDKTRTLVLHDSTSVSMRNAATGALLGMDQITTLRLAQVNESLPDSLFTFVPPEGAREVEGFQTPGQEEAESEFVGRKAPEFTLSDLQGRPVTLASLRGRVVVLDFWATWCKPCRIEMPQVEKLYQELKPKGLAVLGVNFGESPSTVKSFLAKNPCAFPIVLDQKTEIANLYKAEAIPTLVIIDRTGVVRSYFRGVQDQTDLRDAILKGGLNETPPAKPAVRKAAASSGRTSASKTGAARASAPKPSMPKGPAATPPPASKPRP